MQQIKAVDVLENKHYRIFNIPQLLLQCNFRIHTKMKVMNILELKTINHKAFCSQTERERERESRSVG